MDESLGDPAYAVNEWDVGPQTGGTYVVPESAQPNNTPWDSAGGTTGQYGGDVLKILSQGIGAWSQNQKNQQFLDYQRYEATAGGLYAQGRANPATTTASVGVTARASNPLLMIVLIAGAFILLRK